jgi:cytochrome c oxidase subunit IV
MSAHGSTSHAGEQHGGSRKWFLAVWGVLLGLTGIEVFLAYEHLPVIMMLVILLGLSFVKAGLIIAYFMHLRYDAPAFAWTLLPLWIMCTVLLMVVFPDSFRLIQWGWPR